MNIRKDEEGLFRTFSRFNNANLPYHVKVPIVLCCIMFYGHELANLIVFYFHSKVLHNGAKQTLNEIRARYWITSGRWLYCLLLFSNNDDMKKVYVSLYTCASTIMQKQIHLYLYFTFYSQKRLPFFSCIGQWNNIYCKRNQYITVRLSLSVRPLVHLLHFLYIILKDLVVLFLDRTDVF